MFHVTRSTCVFASSLSIGILLGCGKDTSQPTPDTIALVAAGGVDQRAPNLSSLPVPFVVEAQDGAAPISGIKIYWTVTSGGGVLSADSSVTDALGQASVNYTMGVTAGAQLVQARAVGLDGADSTEVFTATALAGGFPYQVGQVPIVENYGIHDTFVRDGLAFVCAWDEGVQIYDVGNGIKGGSPSNPVLVSSIKTAGGQSHNAWWFHNPVTGEKKYLFVGEEGPANIPTMASGDIHVVDVSNLAAPVEVASFSIPGAGTHNFWMDEANQVLFAAYYNGGVVAIDVSGTLTGNLASREIDRIAPAAQTFMWGVQQVNGSLYASDMLGGLWQLGFDGSSLSVAGGGGNVPERYSSDLWIHGGYGYTGTWYFRGNTPGNALKVWQLDQGGAPVLEDSIIVANIGTVSDVEVSADGKLLMFGGERGSSSGFHFYSLADPAHPAFVAKFVVPSGIHTASFATIGGRLYAFGAKDPGGAQLVVLDVTGLVP